MPRLRRRERTRNQRQLGDLNMNDILALRMGWRDRNSGTLFRTIDEVQQFFLDNRDALEVLKSLDYPHGRRPGRFLWCSWKFALSLESQRLRVNPDEIDESSDTFPRGFAWSAPDGFESSFRYLARRKLLEPGEVLEIRRQDGAHLKMDLERLRAGNPHVQRILPWEYADIASIWGENILNPSELKQATPYFD